MEKSLIFIGYFLPDSKDSSSVYPCLAKLTSLKTRVCIPQSKKSLSKTCCANKVNLQKARKNAHTCENLIHLRTKLFAFTESLIFIFNSNAENREWILMHEGNKFQVMLPQKTNRYTSRMYNIIFIVCNMLNELNKFIALNFLIFTAAVLPTTNKH